MRKLFIAAILLISSVSQAQTAAFTEWLKAPKGELAEQKFAKKSLGADSLYLMIH